MQLPAWGTNWRKESTRWHNLPRSIPRVTRAYAGTEYVTSFTFCDNARLYWPMSSRATCLLGSVLRLYTTGFLPSKCLSSMWSKVILLSRWWPSELYSPPLLLAPLSLVLSVFPSCLFPKQFWNKCWFSQYPCCCLSFSSSSSSCKNQNSNQEAVKQCDDARKFRNLEIGKEQ